MKKLWNKMNHKNLTHSFLRILINAWKDTVLELGATHRKYRLLEHIFISFSCYQNKASETEQDLPFYHWLGKAGNTYYHYLIPILRDEQSPEENHQTSKLTWHGMEDGVGGKGFVHHDLLMSTQPWTLLGFLCVSDLWYMAVSRKRKNWIKEPLKCKWAQK